MNCSALPLATTPKVHPTVRPPFYGLLTLYQQGGKSAEKCLKNQLKIIIRCNASDFEWPLLSFRRNLFCNSRESCTLQKDSLACGRAGFQNDICVELLSFPVSVKSTVAFSSELV